MAAQFAGDTSYVVASVTATTLVFTYLTAGAFVIGDQNASVGKTVTFWGARWASANTLSGGAAPANFKGFAASLSTTPAVCGGSWSTGPGNSTQPPGTLPPYMGVIVSSSITQAGPTISGNMSELVVVKTASGYAPDPGHAGTGTVVAEICPAMHQ